MSDSKRKMMICHSDNVHSGIGQIYKSVRPMNFPSLIEKGEYNPLDGRTEIYYIAASGNNSKNIKTVL